jgi:hypothetical protein
MFRPGKWSKLPAWQLRTIYNRNWLLLVCCVRAVVGCTRHCLSFIGWRSWILILHNLAYENDWQCPYFLSPKSTVHSSTSTKFSTRIRLNLVHSRLSNLCEASPYTVRVHVKLNLVLEDPVTVWVLTVTATPGSSEDPYTVMLFDSHRILRAGGTAVTAHVLLKQPRAM